MATTKKVTQAAPMTTDPNALYQALSQANGLTVDPNLINQYKGAVQSFNQGNQAQYLIPDQLKAYLGGISPAFTNNKEQVLAQFSDPKSALYISNPFARLQAAQQTGNAQKQTYNEILQGVQNLMGLGLEQKKQQVHGYQANVEGQQNAIKARQQALQQQFTNALRLQANARAGVNGGQTVNYGTSYVYDVSGNQIGIAHINPKNPKDVVYTNLQGEPLPELPSGFRLGSVSFQPLQEITNSSTARDYTQ